MKLAGSFLVLLALTADCPACAADSGAVVRGSGADPPAAVSVASLAGNPQRYVGATVRVRGTLENAGANFFTDLRCRLRDDEGHSITVRPWLPASVPPGPRRPGVTAPPTLSKYLGKQVDLTAVVEEGALPKSDDRFYLDVQSADVIP